MATFTSHCLFNLPLLYYFFLFMVAISNDEIDKWSRLD